MKTTCDAVNEFKGDWVITDYDQFTDRVSQMKANFGKCANIDLFNYTHGTKELLTKELEVMDKVSCYVCHVGAYPMQQYCGSCGHELLSELVPPQPTITHAQGYDIKGDGDSKTPTYTQAMADKPLIAPKSVNHRCSYDFADEPTLTYTQAMADNADFLPPVNMIVKHKGVKKIVIGELDYNNNLALKSIDNELYSLGHIYDIKPLTPPIELIDGKAYQFECGRNTRLGFFNGKGFIGGVHSYWELSACTNIQPLTVEVK
jgi:hypothetical protein